MQTVEFCVNCGLYYKHVHSQMSIIFQATILAVKNVRKICEKLSFILYLYGQMSRITNTLLWLRTFGRELYAYNPEMQFYGHMTVNHLFIIQGTLCTTLDKQTIKMCCSSLQMCLVLILAFICKGMPKKSIT